MAVEQHQSITDTDYHQFMIEAGPPRELIHGQNPEFPLAMFADEWDQPGCCGTALYCAIKMTVCGRDSVFGRPRSRRRKVVRPSTPRLDTSRSPRPGPV